MLVLIVLLVAVGTLLGGREETAGPGRERISAARIALVERRVEALRGLRFRRPVPVRVITAEQARRYGLAEQRRTRRPARDRAQKEVLKLLGLLAPGADVDRIASAIYGEQVAGFYDSRRERLMLVRGAGVDDVTLAHELTHALEDQHFDLDRLAGRRAERLSDDAKTAYTALLEGSATELMTEYMVRYPEDAPDLGDALAALGDSTSGTPLPPYVMRSLLFPYLGGERFVAALRSGTSGWALVDNALRYRPPVSAAEVIEPDRWLRFDRPAPVRLPSARALGAGWRRAYGSTLGQFDTQELLRSSSGTAAAQRTAAAWEGGRYALWRRGGWAARGCAAPCRARDVLVLGWRMERPHAAQALARELRSWLAALPGAVNALQVDG
ncbi:MAG: hypothetical protein WBC33_06495, partial [Conexibacter sp.]